MASITIPTANNPTPAESKGWVGAAWGNVAAFIPSIIAASINPLLAAAITVTGMATGYFIGKNSGEHDKEKEIKEGKKEVKEPTFFNRNLAKGWVAATALGVATSLIAHTARSANPALSLGITLASGVAGWSILIASSITGKNKMKQEYARAKEIEETARQQSIVKAVEQAAGKSTGHEAGHSAQENQPRFAQTEDNRRAAGAQGMNSPNL